MRSNHQSFIMILSQVSWGIRLSHIFHHHLFKNDDRAISLPWWYDMCWVTVPPVFILHWWHCNILKVWHHQDMGGKILTSFLNRTFSVVLRKIIYIHICYASFLSHDLSYPFPPQQEISYWLTEIFLGRSRSPILVSVKSWTRIVTILTMGWTSPLRGRARTGE